MKNQLITKKIYGSTLMLFAVFAILAAASSIKVSAQTLPPGSYQQSCQKITYLANNLIANCRQKNGSYQDSTLNHYYLCKGDISNQNGNLTCAKDENQTRVQKFINATKDARNRVFGDSDYGSTFGWMDAMMTKNYYQKLFYDETVNGGLLVSFFRDVLFDPKNAALRTIVADRALIDVYGISNKQQRAYYEKEIVDHGAVYITIVSDEQKKLNSSPVVRVPTITAAYQKAFGRPPTTNDFNYWKARTETFKEMVEASRIWLYSSNGVVDLMVTVRRALEAKSGNSPTPEQVSVAVKKYWDTKAIFAEM